MVHKIEIERSADSYKIEVIEQLSSGLTTVKKRVKVYSFKELVDYLESYFQEQL